MSSPVFICHTELDTEWVDLLVEYLEASTSESISIWCSSLPGYALSKHEGEADVYKGELSRVEVVIAVITESAIQDAQSMFDLGVSWALERHIILLMDPKLTPKDLPLFLRDQECLFMQGAKKFTELARKVCTEYIESEQSKDALRRLLGEGEPLERPADEKAADETTEDKTAVWKQDSEPASFDDVDTAPLCAQDVKSWDDETLRILRVSGSRTASTISSTAPANNRKDAIPSAAESLNAGIAMSSCLYNRNEYDSFVKDLDKPFGGFIDALGGNWQSLRGLDDIDVFNGATDNLISSLPPAFSSVSYWYDLGLHVSTILNIAAQGFPKDERQQDRLKQKLQSCFYSFAFLAKEVSINPEDVSQIQHMLKNLMGPEAEKDYSNIAKCMEALKKCAKNADQLPS